MSPAQSGGVENDRRRIEQERAPCEGAQELLERICHLAAPRRTQQRKNPPETRTALVDGAAT